MIIKRSAISDTKRGKMTSISTTNIGMSSNTGMSQQNTGAVKEKKTSDKDLDLSNCNRGVWLVKVPKYIADRWESVEPNATVGKVKLSKRPGEKPLITLSLADKVTFLR